MVCLAALLFLLGGCAELPRTPEQPDLPNVVIIFTDDQGYGDVGVYGATTFTTPHIDRLAREGLRFSNFHASQAVCSASRASLLTGCYAERVSVLGALMPWSQNGLHEDETTIAELLRARGYATSIVGKWHLGHLPEFLPTRHGFDEYLGIPYSNDMWPVDYDGNAVTTGHKKNYPRLPLVDGEETIEYLDTLADQDQLTRRYAERAVDFIDRNTDRPFFLYLAHSMPHVPLGVSDAFRGKSEQGMYGDVIEEIDWSVGQVLAALDRHDLARNTIVIFTSDNGPWLNYGTHAGSTGGFREGKGTAFEGGTRVPAVVRWPGHVRENSHTLELASTIDLLPTIAEAVRAPLPDRPIDGVSLLALIEGRTSKSPRSSFVYYYGRELRAVRNDRFKRVYRHKTRSYVGVEPGNDGHPGPYASPTVPEALYDLENDPAESTDVSAEHPDVVTKLDNLATATREALGDRLQKVKGSEVRPPGRRGDDRRMAVRNRIPPGGLGGIILHNLPARRYSGNGVLTLIDNQLGSADFHDGEWLGFQGLDLVATIDLGKPHLVRKVGASFLRSQASWIFWPKEVQIELSWDGIDYRPLPPKQIGNEPNPAPGFQKVEFTVEGHGRYVRLRAVTIGTCPEWHQAAGGKAWIFCDEIWVE